MSTEKKQDEEFIGMMFDKAVELAITAGKKVRAMVINGEPQMGTMDYDTDRVNVEVKDDVIVAIRGRG